MTGKHFCKVLPPQLFLQGMCSPSGRLPATDRRRRWGKLASVSFCTPWLSEPHPLLLLPRSNISRLSQRSWFVHFRCPVFCPYICLSSPHCSWRHWDSVGEERNWQRITGECLTVIEECWGSIGAFFLLSCGVMWCLTSDWGVFRCIPEGCLCFAKSQFFTEFFDTSVFNHYIPGTNITMTESRTKRICWVYPQRERNKKSSPILLRLRVFVENDNENEKHDEKANEYNNKSITETMRSTMSCIFWGNCPCGRWLQFWAGQPEGSFQLTGGITGRDSPFNIHNNAVYSINRIQRSAQGVLFN